MPKNAKQRTKPNNYSLLRYVSRHLQAAISSLGRLYRAPIASVMTVCVIGIALALPTGLFVLLNNAKSVSKGWEHGTQISVFLDLKTTEQEVNNLMQYLKTQREIAAMNYVSPEQGLKEFEQQANFRDVLSQLPNNPLPPVIEVYPAKSLVTPAAIEKLLRDLRQLPNVSSAQLDMQWLKRLYALIQTGQRAVSALVLILSLGVLLVIGNTIRLSTQNHQQEIEVIQLVGASKGFIRRPFLYTGLFYGLFGGVFAWTLVMLTSWWLETPLQNFLGLYQQHLNLYDLDAVQVLSLLVISSLLGLIGSWFAVNRHISMIEPI